MTESYPQHHEHLQTLLAALGKTIPGPMSGFGTLHKETVAGGVLTTKIKELIALAIAVTVRCDGCIAYHVHDAIQAGAKRQEMVEALAVAVLMGGGPAAVYAAQALEAIEQFEAKKAS